MNQVLDSIKSEVISSKDLTKIQIEKSEDEVSKLVKQEFSKQYENSKVDQTTA